MKRFSLSEPALWAALFAILSILVSPTLARATAATCATQARKTQLEPLRPQSNHLKLAEFAKQNGLPIFLIHTPAGHNVPVILLNKNTIEAWSATLLEQTLGINQSLHPGSNINHGYVRLPGRVEFGQTGQMADRLFDGGSPDAVLIDVFSTGEGVDQIIHGNPYHWKSIAENFRRRSARSRVHIEQAFALSKEDQARMWLYQIVKRSSLVRVQYMFQELNNSWITGKRRVLQQDPPFRQEACAEHCNNSRIGMMAPGHVAEMRGRVSRLLNKDTNRVFNLPETHRFLDAAKLRLLSADWRSESSLHPDLLNEDFFISLMGNHFVSGLSREQQVDALSYLLAINVFEEAIGVNAKYGMHEERVMTLDNPNISAFVVYSDLPDSPDRFRDANFEYFGARGYGFSAQWPGLNPRPLR